MSRRKKQPRDGAAQVATASTAPPAAPTPRWHALLILIIAAAGVAAYWNSFDGAFVLDDDQNIVRKDSLRSERLSDALFVENRSAPGERRLVQRPLTETLLWLNYRIGELDTWSYHLVNLIIHLLAAIALFGVVRRTLSLPDLRDLFGPAAPWLALAVATLFVVHPLQTESVTYIIQRSEALMGLFYFVLLYALIRHATGRRAGLWITLAAAAALLGMMSKAILITAPVLLLLYDRIFLAQSLREIVRRRAVLHALVAVMILFGAGMSGLLGVVPGKTLKTERVDGMELTTGRAQSPIEYYAAQPDITVHYLRLALWPDALCLDYKWPPVTTLSAAIVPDALALMVLLGATVYGLVRVPKLAYPAAWCFIILAPTTLYWNLELAFEHRMYAPLAGLLALVVIGAFLALRTAPRGVANGLLATLCIAATVALAWRTHERNRDYESRLTMNLAVVRERPQNDRGQYNVGNALRREDRKEEAIPYFLEAIELNPNHINAMVNLAVTYADLGRIDEAEAQYRAVLAAQPTHAIGLSNFGLLLVNRARDTRDVAKLTEAADILRRAVERRPDHVRSMRLWGETLMLLGRLEEAQQVLLDAQALQFNEQVRGLLQQIAARLGSG